MAISRIASASTSTSTPTIPAHLAGDLIVVFAFHDGSTTAPTVASGFTSLVTSAGTSCSATIGYLVATSTSDTSASWANTDSTLTVIYRNATLGGVSSASFGTGTTVTYPARTLTNVAAASWFVGFMATTTASVSGIETPPTGMTFINSQKSTDSSAVHDTNGNYGTDWAAQAVAIAGSSGNWLGWTVEIKDTSVPVTINITGNANNTYVASGLAKGSATMVGGANNTYNGVASILGTSAAIPITFVGSASGTTTLTMPAHQTGDLILAYASTTTAATFPTMGGTTTGWIGISSNDTANSATLIYYKYATSNAEVWPTFSNISQSIAQIYRGVTGIGSVASQSGATASGGTTTATYPGITLTNSNSWVASFGYLRPSTLNLESVPSGMTLRQNPVTATQESAGFDTNGPVSSRAAQNVVITGTNATQWGTFTIELQGSRTAPISKKSPDVSTKIGTAFTTGTISGTATKGCFATYGNQSVQYAVGTYNSVQAVYKSVDYGVTWTAILLSGSTFVGSSVAVSETGQYVYITQSAAGLIVKSNDFGVTWTTTGTSATHARVVTSASGQYVYTSFYYSSDYGVTWGTSTNGKSSAPIIACSGDGKYVVMTLSSQGIFLSSNFGATYTAINIVAGTNPGRTYSDIDINSDGSRIYVGGNSVSVPFYMSTNFGVSFTKIGTPVLAIVYVTCSYDGLFVYARDTAGNIYLSRDGGSNWYQPVDPTIPSGRMFVSRSSTTRMMMLDGSNLYSGDYAGIPIDNSYTVANAPITGKANAVGTSSLITTTSAQMIGSAAAAGSSNLVYGQTAFLDGTANAVGTSAISFTGSAVILIPISGTTTVTWMPVANLVGTVPLSSSITGINFSPGTVNLTGSTSLVASANLTFTVAGTQTGKGSLGSGSFSTFVGSAAIQGVGTMVASSSISFSPIASLVGSAPISGSSNVVFTASATIIGSSGISSSTSTSFQAIGTIVGKSSLSSSTIHTYVVNGTAQGAGVLNATSFTSFAITGTLNGKSSLNSTAATSFVAFGSMQGVGSLVGSSFMYFAVNGSTANQIIGNGNVNFSVMGSGLTGSGILSGIGAVSFSSTATLSGKTSLVGSTSFNEIANGNISGQGLLAASSSLTFNGSMLSVSAISASASTNFAVAGTVTGRTSIVGSTTVSFVASGVQTGNGSLATGSFSNFSGTGIVKGDASLVGSLSITFVPILSYTAYLSGSSSISFLSNGSIVNRALKSSSNLTFNVSPSVISGTGKLIGSSNVTFTMQAVPAGLNVIRSNTSINFSASGNAVGLGWIVGNSTVSFKAKGFVLRLVVPNAYIGKLQTDVKVETSFDTSKKIVGIFNSDVKVTPSLEVNRKIIGRLTEDVTVATIFKEI